jgi:hypothetical protein
MSMDALISGRMKKDHACGAALNSRPSHSSRTAARTTASGRVKSEIVGGWLHHADKFRAVVNRCKPAKTYAQWRMSGMELSRFLGVGDKVDMYIHAHFVEVLPPAFMSGECVQMGEPFNHDQQGHARYMTIEKIDGNWFYMGVAPLRK